MKLLIPGMSLGTTTQPQDWEHLEAVSTAVLTLNKPGNAYFFHPCGYVQSNIERAQQCATSCGQSV